MFDFSEVIIIFGLALVVLGPKKLPGAAAQVGRILGRARAMARQFREQLEEVVRSIDEIGTERPRTPPGAPFEPAEPYARPPPYPDPESAPTQPPDTSATHAPEAQILPPELQSMAPPAHGDPPADMWPQADVTRPAADPAPSHGAPSGTGNAEHERGT